jgi:hypothetical protein
MAVFERNLSSSSAKTDFTGRGLGSSDHFSFANPAAASALLSASSASRLLSNPCFVSCALFRLIPARVEHLSSRHPAVLKLVFRDCSVHLVLSREALPSRKLSIMS